MDRDALLDRFDVAVGRPGTRAHTWPWLRDENGDRLAVDSYWADERVALVLLDVPAPPDWVAAAATTAARGITLIGLPPAGVGDGDPRLLRMLLLSDSAVSMSTLAQHGADLWNRAATADDGEWVVFGTTDLGPDGEQWENDWDDGDVFEGEDQDAFDDEEEERDEYGEDQPPPRVQLGWRTRPIALSALGAATLGRRVFADELTAPIDSLEMQLLVAVAVSDDATTSPGDDVGGLAVRLGIHVSEAQYAERSLAKRGLVLAPPPYPDGEVIPTVLTDAGRDLVERWLARVLPLFAGWPPEHPETDDAIG